jgi:hypothetical protein
MTHEDLEAYANALRWKLQDELDSPGDAMTVLIMLFCIIDRLYGDGDLKGSADLLSKAFLDLAGGLKEVHYEAH